MNEIDHSLFLFLNSLHSSFFDAVMSFLSMKAVWIPLYLFIIYLLVKKYNRRVWIPVLLALVLVGITDQVSGLIKGSVERLRPCHDPALSGLVHTVNGKCGGMYGFVSAHAANTFGLASFTSPLIAKSWYTTVIYIWAISVSYSRIYLGVHFPGDVLAGASLGIIVGITLSFIVKRTDKRTA